MAGKKKMLLNNLPMKLILISVLAVILLLSHSRTGHAAASDVAQSVTSNGVTLLDPFSLDDLVVSMEITGDRENPDWWKEHHRHRHLRSPYKPPFPD